MRVKSLFLLFAIFLLSCGSKNNTTVQKTSDIQLVVPDFSSDSAYSFVQNQIDFGPRVPNTDAHKQCAVYLSEKLTQYGANVTEQRVKLTAYNGDMLNSINIIGSFNQNARNRVLLMAHWDSRPWSDHDPDPQNRNVPVMGANDGASGVGVLLEVARHLKNISPDFGVDIVLFDSEDYGAPSDFQGPSEDSWCLGSQYWSKNPHIPGYRANFGILLDMVGAENAKFYKEQISMYYAPQLMDRVWAKAQSLGFSNFFVNDMGGGVTDDHLYVNQIAGIPSIDIIQHSPESDSGFGHYWHTTQDDMSVISRPTLLAVGTTLLHILFEDASKSK